MLEKARATPSRVRWQHGDLADWQPEEVPSLLFSNAVIHWLPDHRSLITRPLVPAALGRLPCGAGADELGPALAPPHAGDPCRRRCGRRAACSVELRRATESPGLHDPGFYYDLVTADAAHLDVWTTEYLHALTGTDAVLEWSPPPACARS